MVVTRQWENRYGDDRDDVVPSASGEVVVERDEMGTILRDALPAQPVPSLVVGEARSRALQVHRGRPSQPGTR